jgi:hypothetical protein
MIDFKAVELELSNARRARIAAELACCDVEEFAESIRQSQAIWMRKVSARPASEERMLH